MLCYITPVMPATECSPDIQVNKFPVMAGLKNSTRPLICTSTSDCSARENLDDFQCKLTFSPYMPIFLFDARQMPVFRYFKACMGYFLF